MMQIGLQSPFCFFSRYPHA